MDVNLIGREELAHGAVLSKGRTKGRYGGSVAIAFVAEDQDHGASWDDLAHVSCLGDVLANAAEVDAGQQLRMPGRFTPLLRWGHLHGYGLLGGDIDMDIPGLVAGLEDVARVIIGRVQASALVVCCLPIESGLLSAAR